MNSGRMIFVIIGLFLFLVTLVLRLVFIQIKQHKYYLEIATRQQNKSEIVLAERGTIKDRNNELLAYSKNEVDIFVDFAMLKNDDRKRNRLSAGLEKVFGKSLNNYKLSQSTGNSNVLIESKVPKIKAITLENIGVDAFRIEDNPSRIYPYKNLASHVIGFVNKKNLGIMGIEEKFNDDLKGFDGIRQIEKDVLGRTVSVKDNLSRNPVAGKTIILTIDKTIQTILETELKNGNEEFGAEDAIGIIMNPNNGEILALANYPDFDPSSYSNYNDHQRRNRAITDSYEMGSTMKPVVMSILLDQDKVKENEVINTENGVYEYKNAKIRDSHKYSALTVREIIEHSSNIGMVKLSSRISDDDFYKYLRNFGFGNYTGIGISGEVNGMLKKPSQFGSTSKAYMSFGYELTATPIQLISAYSAIVNGGVLYKPLLVKRLEDQNGNTVKEFSSIKIREVISKSASDKIKKFMIGAVENGTAKSAQISNIKLGGKTGTSQRLVDGDYSKEEYNTSFVGFFPADSPKYVCLIIYTSPKKAKYGGLVAAPVFKKIVEKIIQIEPEKVILPTKIERNKIVDEIFSDVKLVKDTKQTSFSDLAKPAKAISKRSISKTSVMPDLTNKSLKSAMMILKSLNVEVKVVGHGKVVNQSIEAGSEIKQAQQCTLTCKSDFQLKNIKLN